MNLAVTKLFNEDPWERQTGEDQRDWEIFQLYIKTPPEERVSLSESVCRNYQINRSQLEKIAKENDWLKRTTRYDAYQNSLQRQVALRMRTEAGINMIGLSRDMLKKASDAFQALENAKKVPSYRDVVEMVRLAIELNRSGLSLQGVTADTDNEISVTGDNPEDLIRAATQVNILIRNNIIKVERLEDATITEGEIIEGRISGEHGEG